VIGFHEHEGTFYYAVIDLEGTVLALGEVDLPPFVRPKHDRAMTTDTFAFETAVRMVRRSMTRQYARTFQDHPPPYTAFIGIEDTGWKRDHVGTDAADNRQRVSLPRQRIIEIVTYKAVLQGLPAPRSISGIAPSRDCGHCGARMEASAVQQRAVTHCFHCATLGIEHTLERHEDTKGNTQMQCTACRRIWQKEEPQFKCQHCRTQQHARYNTALATVHRTVDRLVGRKSRQREAE
jgi:transposase